MAVSLELLNSTQSEYSGDLIFAFERHNELMAELYDAKQVKFKGGTYIERPFSKGMVGNTTKIRNGTEMLTRTSNNILEKLRVQPGRTIHSLYIPKTDLAQNTGKNAVVQLINQYPVNDLKMLGNDKNRYFLTGTTSGRGITADKLYVYLTLNGDFASGQGEGVTNGLLDFVVPASQSDTVENVAKSSATGHYNQYGLITGFSTNGSSTIKSVLRKCIREGGHKDGRTYVLFMDDVTFGNLEAERDGKVRLSLNTDKTEAAAVLDLGLYGATVYSSADLLPSVFSGTGTGGVTYIVDKDHIEYQVVEKTEFGEWRESEDQDVVYNKLVEHGNWIMQQFPAHGVVAGGNA